MSLQVSIIVITWQMGNPFRYSIEDRQGDIITCRQVTRTRRRKTVDTNGTKTKTKKLKGMYKSIEAETAVHMLSRNVLKINKPSSVLIQLTPIPP